MSEVVLMTMKRFCTACVTLITVFAIACDLNNRQGPVALKISKELRESCRAEKPCEVKAADMTDVSWDQLYVFDSRVEGDVISKELGSGFGESGPYYTNKWFFL